MSESPIIENYIVKSVGSKDEVWEGKAKQTSGGLKKEDLCENAHGKIVSKKRSEHGKKMAANLKRHKAESNINEEEEKSPIPLNDSLTANIPEVKEEIKEEIKSPLERTDSKGQIIQGNNLFPMDPDLAAFCGEKIKKPRKKKN